MTQHTSKGLFAQADKEIELAQSMFWEMINHDNVRPTREETDAVISHVVNAAVLTMCGAKMGAQEASELAQAHLAKKAGG